MYSTYHAGRGLTGDTTVTKEYHKDILYMCNHVGPIHKHVQWTPEDKLQTLCCHQSTTRHTQTCTISTQTCTLKSPKHRQDKQKCTIDTQACTMDTQLHTINTYYMYMYTGHQRTNCKHYRHQSITDTQTYMYRPQRCYNIQTPCTVTNYRPGLQKHHSNIRTTIWRTPEELQPT